MILITICLLVHYFPRFRRLLLNESDEFVSLPLPPPFKGREDHVPISWHRPCLVWSYVSKIIQSVSCICTSPSTHLLLVLHLLAPSASSDMDLTSLKDQVSNLTLYDLKAGVRKVQNGKLVIRKPDVRVQLTARQR
jgi:hypothetical protein